MASDSEWPLSDRARMFDLDAITRSFQGIDFTPLVFALVLGGAVGLEREWHGRPAGLRTHILVCLSSTLLILVSRSVAAENIDPGVAGKIVFDPNRMGAGIVTGIGFLGAATVLRSGDLLRGLTTAACIWFVAGLGIVLGTGNYGAGVAGTVVVILTLTLVSRISGFIKPVVYRRVVVASVRREMGELVPEVREELRRAKMRLLDLASATNSVDGRTELTFYLALKNDLQAPALIERIGKLKGVVHARWRLIS